jgi:hypothetical protein
MKYSLQITYLAELKLLKASAEVFKIAKVNELFVQ